LNERELDKIDDERGTQVVFMAGKETLVWGENTLQRWRVLQRINDHKLRNM
jgi:hypothetical protein